jgi:hypothetical protein
VPGLQIDHKTRSVTLTSCTGADDVWYRDVCIGNVNDDGPDCNKLEVVVKQSNL